MKSKNLIGKKVVITSDNDSYSDFFGKTLICTHASNSGIAYDKTMFPQMLCDFKCEDGKDFPFALYEYEFSIIQNNTK
jgi:hypothetical protein